MRVLQLDVSYSHSSAGKIVKCLQTELIVGHACLVLFGRGISQNEMKFVRILHTLDLVLLAGYICYIGLIGCFPPGEADPVTSRYQ